MCVLLFDVSKHLLLIKKQTLSKLARKVNFLERKFEEIKRLQKAKR